MKSYETEVRERYGNTASYREHEQKTKNYTKEKWAEANDGLMAIFAEFSACKNRGVSADSVEVQTLVAKLQAHITANCYTCTDEILAGLGKMYVADGEPQKLEHNDIQWITPSEIPNYEFCPADEEILARICEV